MPTKTIMNSAEVTYTFASTTWTQHTAFKRQPGLDLMGVQVQATCGTWSGSTVRATLQGCIVDDDFAATPDDNSGWQDIETLDFTANAFKRFGASTAYLAGVAGFQWYRVKGATQAGAPGANVTLAILTNGDCES